MLLCWDGRKEQGLKIDYQFALYKSLQKEGMEEWAVCLLLLFYFDSRRSY